LFIQLVFIYAANLIWCQFRWFCKIG